MKYRYVFLSSVICLLTSASQLSAIDNRLADNCRDWLKNIEEKNYQTLSLELRMQQAANQAENELWKSQLKTASEEKRKLLTTTPNVDLCQMVVKNIKSTSANKISTNLSLTHPWQMEAIEFLQEEFLEAKRLPPLRWKNWEKMFGKAISIEFFTSTFHSGRYVASVDNKSARPENSRFELLEVNLAKPILRDADKKITPKWNQLFITEYDQIDDQAKELHLLLRNRLDELKNKKVILLTTAYNSAIFAKLIDLYPEWRSEEQILGWLNLDGDLFPKKIPSQQIALIETPMPLGAGFPIVNLLQKKRLEEPRLSVINDGDTVFIDDKANIEMVIQAGVNRLDQIRPN